MSAVMVRRPGDSVRVSSVSVGPFFFRVVPARTDGNELAYAAWYFSRSPRAAIRRWTHKHLRVLPRTLDQRYMQQKRKNDELTARVRELERQLRR